MAAIHFRVQISVFGGFALIVTDIRTDRHSTAHALFFRDVRSHLKHSNVSLRLFFFCVAKAMQMLEVIMASFIICWTPFFVCYTVTNGLCDESCPKPPEFLEAVFFWLGKRERERKREGERERKRERKRERERERERKGT